uniref:C2H2-type domain-containing protein n=1 Tax=Ditylenchus dipsaci TaxID=166011 RepID=A0A915DI17_9BILA
MKMGISELEEILRQKIVEKLGKSAWHPSTLTHKCAGSGSQIRTFNSLNRPLSTMDIAILDYHDNSSRNIQCLWCGFFMDEKGLATHFAEFHFNLSMFLGGSSTILSIMRPGIDCECTIDRKIWPRVQMFNSVDELEQAIKSLAHIQPDLFFMMTQFMSSGKLSASVGEEMFANSFDTKQGLSCSAFSNSRASLVSSSRKPKLALQTVQQEYMWCGHECCGNSSFQEQSSDSPTKYSQELCELRLERMGKGCMVMLSPYESSACFAISCSHFISHLTCAERFDI